MGFSDAVGTCWKKYGDFDGRAARSEFWWWALFVGVVQFVAAIVLTIVLIIFHVASLCVLAEALGA